jgi:TRAP-type C4-dicarboxylate transport system permease small subunit
MSVLLAGMALLVGAQIAGRFVFGYSIPWSDELARFLLVWISFLGLSVAARRGAHPGIDTVVHALPRRLAGVARRLGWLLSLLFVALVLASGAELVRRTWGQHSPSLGLRMAWPYLAVPLSGLLVLLHWIARGATGVAPGGREDANG